MIMMLQQLNPRNFKNRLVCHQRILEVFPEKAVVFFRDETQFHFLGCINKRKMLFWSATNTRGVDEGPLQGDKGTVWCTISVDSFIGLIS